MGGRVRGDEVQHVFRIYIRDAGLFDIDAFDSMSRLEDEMVE